MLPAITYRPSLPGAPLQAVGGADRPICALTSALASHMRGEKLLGAARNLAESQVNAMFISAYQSESISPVRALKWADVVARGTKIGGAPPPGTRVGALKLSAYQADAIGQLTAAGGILGFAVGLGKTVTACAAACYYASGERRLALNERCWIVAPLVALGAWKPYIAWLQLWFKDVRLISIDSAHKLVGADRTLGGVLIIDEIHLAGHYTSRRSKALFKVRYGFDVCLGLTGTLLHAGVEPALTVLDLVIPGAAQFSTRWAAGEYFHCLVRKQIGARTVTGLERPTGSSRDRFLDFLHRHCVLLTKHSPSVKSELTIPEQELQVIEIGDPDGENVDDCVVRIATSMIDPETGQLPPASAVRHAALREGVETKIDWLLEQYDGTPIVVFAEYKDSLAQARAKFDALGIRYAYIDGDVIGDDRIEQVRRFQDGEVPVFLGQIDAAGASINLYRSFISITLDLTTRANNYAQMLGRTCRRGQTETCTHLDLVANCIQAMCLRRLRAGEDFHMALVNWSPPLDAAPTTE